MEIDHDLLSFFDWLSSRSLTAVLPLRVLLLEAQVILYVTGNANSLLALSNSIKVTLEVFFGSSCLDTMVIVSSPTSHMSPVYSGLGSMRTWYFNTLLWTTDDHDVVALRFCPDACGFWSEC